MPSTTAIKLQDDKLSSLGLSKTIVNQEQVTCYSRSLGSASEKNPVLVLIHGYPQSSYMWRHVIPLLPPTAPIFVADLPGYGGSAAIPKNDKVSAGTAILNALKTEVKRTSNGSSSVSIPVVLIGHDRGARVSHHITVQQVDSITILGTCLIDIVPTSTQWQNYSIPSTSSKAITGYFHWPFLANTDLATRMITAFGPANWCKEMILNWSGSSSAGLASLKADDALAVYGAFFEQEGTLKASNEDYEHGATTDVEREEKWQKEGKKVKVPLLLIYGADFIGKRYQFPDVWREWVDDGVEIKSHGLGGGVGHFGAEEAPEESVEVILGWLKELGYVGA
ncbi:alpha/beta-hydrolase [Plenodomus tracheiphilus IPT5]|uniref:Alpha/beta-hydrolase n=1 Tax=Plenodomus tracheiphilus IPT5 TaxID=1408161 RepID=A0A6A7BEN8_9PLEO|nr:alpha/beta-hydrolase [Plenodomus tracheiphilus IPT5]